MEKQYNQGLHIFVLFIIGIPSIPSSLLAPIFLCLPTHSVPFIYSLCSLSHCSISQTPSPSSAFPMYLRCNWTLICTQINSLLINNSHIYNGWHLPLVPITLQWLLSWGTTRGETNKSHYLKCCLHFNKSSRTPNKYIQQHLPPGHFSITLGSLKIYWW